MIFFVVIALIIAIAVCIMTFLWPLAFVLAGIVIYIMQNYLDD